MSEPRRAFSATTDACLHCLVWRIIDEHSPKIDGRPLYQAEEIIGNLVDVIAEVIASHPDANARFAWIAEAQQRLRLLVAACVAEGSHPEGVRRH
jgi:hypothetical protein